MVSNKKKSRHTQNKNKIKAWLTSLTLTLSIGVSYGMMPYTATTVQAYSKTCNMRDGCQCGSWEVDPVWWNQGPHGHECNLNWSDFVYGTETIEHSGCFSMSLANIMALSGDFGQFCPMCLFNWGASHNLWSGNSLNATNVVNVEGYENVMQPIGMTAEDFSQWAAYKNSRSDKFGETGSADGQILYEIAVDLASKGYYIIVSVPGHFMPVYALAPTINDNPTGYDLVLADSGSVIGDGTGGRMIYTSGTVSWTDEQEVKAEESGIPFARHDSANLLYTSANLECIYVYVSASPFKGGANATNNASLKDKQNACAIQYTGLAMYLEEEYFVDIDSLIEGMMYLPTSADLNFDLGYDGMNELKTWKDTITNRKERKLHSAWRVVLMLIGIIIIIYSILLFVMYQLDSVNNFIDIDFLGLVTFNRLGVNHEATKKGVVSGTSAGVSKKLLSLKGIIGVCITGITIGVLIISGKIFDIAVFIIQLIEKVLGIK